MSATDPTDGDAELVARSAFKLSEYGREQFQEYVEDLRERKGVAEDVTVDFPGASGDVIEVNFPPSVPARVLDDVAKDIDSFEAYDVTRWPTERVEDGALGAPGSRL